MNKTLIGTFGFILLLAAIALPFLHLGQSKADILPLAIAFLAALAAGAFFVLAMMPHFFKRYLIGVAALLVILVGVGLVGLFSTGAPRDINTTQR